MTRLRGSEGLGFRETTLPCFNEDAAVGPLFEAGHGFRVWGLGFEASHLLVIAYVGAVTMRLGLNRVLR